MKEVKSRNKVLLCLPINFHVYLIITDGHFSLYLPTVGQYRVDIFHSLSHVMISFDRDRSAR